MAKTFGIIAAMDEECDSFIAMLADKQSHQFGSVTIHQGIFEQHMLYVVRCGIGKVAAAAATALLIEKFDPDYILNTGSAGGFSKNLNIGDVVIASAAAFHDVDVTAFGYELGQLPSQPLWFMMDETLQSAALSTPLSHKQHKIVAGTVISGDSFISQKPQLLKLHESFPDADIIDMEAAAIAQICHMFQKSMLVVRSVSDLVHKESPMDFNEFLPLAAQNALDVVTYIIKEINNGTNR